MNQYVLSIILLFALINNVVSEWTDVNWMGYIKGDLKLNQINIPGTHDSSTFGITVTNENNNNTITPEQVVNEADNSNKNIYRTQDKSIKEQLNIGVRYFDIRMAWHSENQIHIVHDIAACVDENGQPIFLKNVLNDCSEFLKEHNSETVILHLKLEDKNGNNHQFIKNQVNEYINDYIKNDKMYDTENPENKNRIPKLDEVRSKIVIVTRQADYNGIHLALNDKPTDVQYDIKKCDFNDKYECRIQDGYELFMEQKWEAVEKLIADQKLINQGDPLGENVLALNFMSTTKGDLEEVANSINNKLVNEESNNAILVSGKQYGWILADFINKNVTNYIYKSNIQNKEEDFASSVNSNFRFSVYTMMAKYIIKLVKVFLWNN